MISIEKNALEARTLRIGKYTLPLSGDSLEGLEGEVHDLSLEPIEFYFEYLKFKFKCTCFDTNPGSPPIFTLTSNMGPVPFTAQSPVARHAALTIVKAANTHLNGAVRLVEGNMVFGTFSPIESQVTSTILVTAIVTAIHRIKPYLELLREVLG